MHVPPNATVQIAVIEDDQALQEAYCFILERAGYHVEAAYNGEEGLRLTKGTTFDIILLDVHMPIMDGITFLRQYGPHKPAKTKIIIFSNMVEPDIEKEAMALGAERCVLKSSMTPATMLEMLKSMLP